MNIIHRQDSDTEEGFDISVGSWSHNHWNFMFDNYPRSISFVVNYSDGSSSTYTKGAKVND